MVLLIFGALAAFLVLMWWLEIRDIHKDEDRRE